MVDESIHLPVNDTELFVRLSGNEAGPMVVYLHGGPGGFSTFQHHRYRDVLEPDYLLAYLDQRGCGQSRDIATTDELNTTQYLRDLDSVIAKLSDRYAKSAVNLIGDSWGGTYALLYALQHQAKVTALVSNGGVADVPYMSRNLIEKELQLATQLLLQTEDSERKSEYQEILTELKRMQREIVGDAYQDMVLVKRTFPRQLNFNPYRVKPHPGPPSDEVLADAGVDLETAKGFFVKGKTVNKAFRSDATFNSLNIVRQLADLHLPVLVIQGDSDYSIGIDQGRMIHAGLTQIHARNKHLEIIPDTGHDTAEEKPEVVLPLIRRFLDTYN